MHSILLSIEGISLHIGQKDLLQDLSFSICEGEFVSIIGPNGSGKSTCLKCIMDLLPPTKGEIYLQGVKNTCVSPFERAKVLSYVPQEKSVSPYFHVDEFVMMSRYSRQVEYAPERDRQMVKWALEQTGCTSFSSQKLDQLSGGECQKVFLACALAQESPLMLLDEPSSFLDPAQTKEIYQMLKRINHEWKKTILMVSHDLHYTFQVSDKIFAMQEGRCHFWGKTNTFVDPHRLQELYGIPFTMLHPSSFSSPILLPSET